MTIQLPNDLEASVRTLVQDGRYATIDEAMADAARLLLRLKPVIQPATKDAFHQHLIDIGLMSQLPDTDADYDDPDDQPVTIQGESLSETVIRERR